MNVPRKPSASPPVQLQSHSQQRAPVQYPRGPTPPVQQYRPPGQEDYAQLLAQQQPQVYQQQRFPQGYPSQGLGAHELSKQQLASHVGAAGGQTAVQPQASQIMYMPTSQPVQRHAAHFVRPRNSVPQNIPHNQQRQTMTATSPSQQMNYQHLQATTMFMPGQSPQFMAQPGTQVIIQPGQIHQYNNQGQRMPAPGAYTINPSQPAAPYTMTSNPQQSYYPPPPGNNAVFYPQQPMQVTPQRPQMTQPQAHYQSKREKKILRITDPNTGRDINEEILGHGATPVPAGMVPHTGTGGSGSSKTSTPPHSGSSSAGGTPAPPGGSGTPPQQPQDVDIAAQFAAQVAATLNTRNMGAPPQQPPYGGVAPHPGAPTGQPRVAVVQPQQQQAPSHSGPVPADTIYQAQPPPVKPAPAPIVEPSGDIEVVRTAPVEEAPESSPPKEEPPPVEEPPVEVHEQTPPLEVEPPSVSEAEAQPEVVPQTVEADCEAEQPSASSEAQEEVRDSPDSVTRTPNEPEITPDSQEVTREVSPVAAVKAESDQVMPEEKVVVKEDGKDGKKKSRTQKKKELNEKGQSKEGTDMDAFVSEVREPSPEASSPAPEVTPSPVAAAEVNNVEADKKEKTPEPEPEPEAQPVEVVEEPVSKPQPPPEPVVEDKPVPQAKIDTVDSKVEDEKVAEENEKNDEKSKEEAPIESSQTIEETESVMKKDKTQLKYTYREDQWSPINQEGKKEYDRAFLLQLQFAAGSVEKPEGLPKLPDVILDKPIQHNAAGPTKMGGMGMGGRNYGPGPLGVPDFTPGFIKPSPGGKTPSMTKRGSQSRGQGGGPRGGPPPKVISISMGHEVKLKTTENAWKPAHKDSANKDAESVRSEALFKKVRSILNKLTPQKFQTLIQQILDLDIDSEERLVGTIDLIFEKAIDEPNFSVAYANMCKCMIQIKVPTKEDTSQMVTFRKLLLNRCQKEFQKDQSNQQDIEALQKEIDAAPEEKKPELQLKKEEVEAKAKRRSLGNIRFIGELFKLKMLTEVIMHDCLLTLLRQSHDEDNLECLCRLLTTIGKDIDHEKAKPRVDQYFTQMEKIVRKKETSSRIRFMLQDVMDLRHVNWKPRREDNNPKTIDQIHREVKQEEVQQAINRQQAAMQPKRHERQARPARPPQGAPQGEDGWTSVSTKAGRQVIDPTKMKLSKQTMDENIQLGPGGPRFGSWGRGSSGGGSKMGSQESERPSTPGNRFSALSAGAGAGAGESYDSRNRMGATPGLPPRGTTPGRDSRGRTPQSMGRGRAAAQRSQELEREGAVSAVRSLLGGGSRTPGGSREHSRDNSRNREVAKPAPPAAKELPVAEIEKKTKAIMDEYLHLQDIKEAILCVQELESPKTIHTFVSTAVNHVLERSQQARRLTGTLLHDLVKKGVVNVDSYLKGLKDVLDFAEDMEIDIPMIWQYLGELIGPMVSDGSVPLNFLKPACEALIQCNKAGTLLAKVLHDAAQRLGHIKVGEQWKNSGLHWTDFLPAGADVSSFVRDKKLEFTVGGEEPRSPDAKSLPLVKVQEELDNLITRRKADNEEVFDWIEANVGETESREPNFIRALMTSVCTSALVEMPSAPMKVEQAAIQRRSILLQKFLDHQAELELQALYALQALVDSHHHPAGVLRTFFDTLYDEDIISEDAFNQWESSDDPAEQQGKGVARTSVIQFFTWLREAEEESQEDQ